LSAVLKVAPNLTTTELVRSNISQSPMSQVDVKFTNTNYLQNVKAKLQRQISTAISGSGYAFDCADMFMEVMRRMYAKNKDIIKASCMGGKQSPAFISFQSNEMSERTMEVFNSKQVDTIMSLSHPQYFQGNTWVTSTSTWDIHMQTQVPCILTIHFGMSVLDYRCHFDTDNSNFEKCKTVVGGDLTNLMSIYPGHTMDMSGALYQ
jgi:peroxiredoxin